MTFAPPVIIRLFKPAVFLLPDGATMPPVAPTVGLPECILCRRKSPAPPARLGWVSERGLESLILVCADCGNIPDEALELRILAQISEPRRAA
jgi:hypothetical protein